MTRGEDKEKDSQEAGDHRRSSACVADSRPLANGSEHLARSAAPCPVPAWGLGADAYTKRPSRLPSHTQELKQLTE